jgi:hypothetical protein
VSPEDADARARRAEHERAAAGEGHEPDVPLGWYAGGVFLGAVAPAFPGVAGAAGGEAFVGHRHDSSFDTRLGLAGFGASFGSGSLGVVGLRVEEFIWLAGPYGIGVGLGPFVGVSQDVYGSSAIGGAHLSATPVALRFPAGAALLEVSLVGGTLLGSHELIDGAFVRPFGFLGFAAYSR